MKEATHRQIYLTEFDVEKLEKLVEISPRSAGLEMLKEELSLAIVVKPDELPPNVISMNSRIRFRDVDTNEESELTLVYPKDGNIDQGKISVLAPVGTALLGLSVGELIVWPVPSGKTRKLEIISVIFQPEAAGRYDL